MRLEALGYLTRVRTAMDRRCVAPKLTAKGRGAVAGTSVLDAKRVAEVLERLSSSERKRAAEGLALLATAASAIVRKTKE